MSKGEKRGYYLFEQSGTDFRIMRLTEKQAIREVQRQE
jgi:hypothetical protein